PHVESTRGDAVKHVEEVVAGVVRKLRREDRAGRGVLQLDDPAGQVQFARILDAVAVEVVEHRAFDPELEEEDVDLEVGDLGVASDDGGQRGAPQRRFAQGGKQRV